MNLETIGSKKKKEKKTAKEERGFLTWFKVRTCKNIFLSFDDTEW